MVAIGKHLRLEVLLDEMVRESMGSAMIYIPGHILGIIVAMMGYRNGSVKGECLQQRSDSGCARDHKDHVDCMT
jgi:hypothetical protein